MRCSSKLSYASLKGREEVEIRGEGGAAPEGARQTVKWLISADSDRGRSSQAHWLLRGNGFFPTWLLFLDNLQSWSGIQSSVGLSINLMHSGSLQLALISSAFNLAVNSVLILSIIYFPKEMVDKLLGEAAQASWSIEEPVGGHCEGKNRWVSGSLIYFLLWKTSCQF